MLASLPLEVDSVFTPGMQVRNEFERLARPGVKWMSDLETSAQSVCISCSRRLKPTPAVKSFIKTLKHEEVYRAEYRDLADAHAQIGEFLERVYNRQRLHSALGYVPPTEFEQNGGALQ